MSALLPCPFCGGSADLHSPRFPIACDCDDAAVKCLDCDAIGPAILCDMSDEDAEIHWPAACATAINAWNARRTTPLQDAAPDLLSALQALADYAGSINGAMWRGEDQPAVKAARQAIARATGHE